jgi:hypothetical protein
VIFALSRHFPPRPDDGAFFAERMTARVSPPVAINDPTSPYRPHLKAAHRADAMIEISFGSHTVFNSRWRAIHHWHPAEVLHFPYRSLRQWENKGVRRARGDKPLGQYVTALHAAEGGRGAERFRALTIDDDALERGRAEGSLVVDVRLRDALRALRGTALEKDAPAADPGLVSEGVAVRDADLVRLARFVDGLSARLGDVEARAR